MKERPILFSSPMVRALLRQPDPKTMTRRLRGLDRVNGLDSDQWEVRLETADSVVFRRKGTDGLRKPPGPLIDGVVYCDNEITIKKPCVAGDHLWVRETWSPANPESEYPNDGRPRRADDLYQFAWYRATDKNIVAADDDGMRRYDRSPWKPSIFMPRWASRITLEVTGVRVERLQDITDADAEAEGVLDWAKSDAGMGFLSGLGVAVPDRPRFLFRLLWLGIHGAESWDASPYVWVVSFKRVEATP